MRRTLCLAPITFFDTVLVVQVVAGDVQDLLKRLGVDSVLEDPELIQSLVPKISFDQVLEQTKVIGVLSLRFGSAVIRSERLWPWPKHNFGRACSDILLVPGVLGPKICGCF